MGMLIMKTPCVAALVLGIHLLSNPNALNAQTAAGVAPAVTTRAQVKMERDEWFKTHHWDDPTDQWILNRDVEPPVGVKSRSEVKAQRDTFLKNNRWDDSRSGWVPIKGTPRSLSAMTRKQVRDDTRRFARTHHFDEQAGVWVDAPVRAKPR
jgi:hypothetical protein